MLTALPVILPLPTQLFVLWAHLIPLLPVSLFQLKVAVRPGNVSVPVEEQRLLVWLLEMQFLRLPIPRLKLLLILPQPIKQ
jgi:hypothetical protein